jgi:hypothetical protein
LMSRCSHTARTAAAAGTTFRGNGPYARIIGCAIYFAIEADVHIYTHTHSSEHTCTHNNDAAVIWCAFCTSCCLVQKKKHPGVAIPIPAHILPTACQNDKSCKNTVSIPRSIFCSAAALQRLLRCFLWRMTPFAGVRFSALKPWR